MDTRKKSSTLSMLVFGGSAAGLGVCSARIWILDLDMDMDMGTDIDVNMEITTEYLHRIGGNARIGWDGLVNSTCV